MFSLSVCGCGLASVHTRVNAALVLNLRGHRFDLTETELVLSAAEDMGGALHRTIDQCVTENVTV